MSLITLIVFADSTARISTTHSIGTAGVITIHSSMIHIITHPGIIHHGLLAGIGDGDITGGTGHIMPGDITIIHITDGDTITHIIVTAMVIHIMEVITEDTMDTIIITELVEAITAHADTSMGKEDLPEQMFTEVMMEEELQLQQHQHQIIEETAQALVTI